MTGSAWRERVGALTILVPDTNALLFNPALEDWDPGVQDTFEIWLVPL